MVNSILLGLIQGLTEFLPVSSSGHLVIFSTWLKSLSTLSEQLFFDVMLHFGTLVAVFIVFKDRIIKIIREREKTIVLHILVAMVPTGLIALGFKDTLEGLFGVPRLAAAMLLVTGTVLLLTRFKGSSDRSMTIAIALAVGTLQGLAIIPGISRSGATIAGALLLGVKREEAGTFSFLLSIPAVLCAVLLKTKDLVADGGAAAIAWGPVIAGTITACVVGVLALRLLMVFVKQGRLYRFSIYCYIVGILGIFIL